MKSYYPSINLLRAIAAIMVCMAHFIGYIDNTRGSLFPTDGWLYQISKSGLNGVYIFFVVSGFVIPLALSHENYTISKWHRFISRRFIRIELPYFASIIIILLIRLIYSFKNHTPFQLDIEQIFYHLVYFIPFTNLEWFSGQYWTLAIEFQFYLMIGLLYILFTSKNKFVMAISLTVFAGLNFIIRDDRLIFYYSIIFIQGILLFLIKNKRIKPTAGWICIATSVFATAYLHSIEIAVSCSATLLVIQFLKVDGKITNRLGDISYSLYLTHVTIGGNMLYLFFKYFHSPGERLILVFITFVAALSFAYAFWWLIERPSRKLSKKIRI